MKCVDLFGEHGSVSPDLQCGLIENGIFNPVCIDLPETPKIKQIKLAANNSGGQFILKQKYYFRIEKPKAHEDGIKNPDQQEQADKNTYGSC